MSDWEIWMLAYVVATSVAGHCWLAYRIRERRKHYRRSLAARKAAETRKRNGTRASPRKKPAALPPNPWTPPQQLKPPAPKDERTVGAESAWFRILNDTDDEAPSYNEVDPATWKPKVRRFPGGAAEYSRRDE
jgi:hypothetical protein